jgi:histidinol phosphatase-like PHP family hydrolase
VPALPREILEWCAVATHVHTRFLYNPTCSGKQTVEEAAQSALALGFEGLAFAEHTSDPRSPSLSPELSLVNALYNQGETVHSLKCGIRLFSGVEANIMPDGVLDIDSAYLAKVADYRIASQHGGLGVAEKDPKAIEARLKTACRNEFVDTLGHPSRYNSEVPGVDWSSIFRVAYETNTAVELNINLWYTQCLQGYDLTSVSNRKAVMFWAKWMKLLASSRAPVVIGLDIHKENMWPQPQEEPNSGPTFLQFYDFIQLMRRADISWYQVINSSAVKFEHWLRQPKAKRSMGLTI